MKSCELSRSSIIGPPTCLLEAHCSYISYRKHKPRICILNANLAAHWGTARPRPRASGQWGTARQRASGQWGGGGCTAENFGPVGDCTAESFGPVGDCTVESFRPVGGGLHGRELRASGGLHGRELPASGRGDCTAESFGPVGDCTAESFQPVGGGTARPRASGQWGTARPIASGLRTARPIISALLPRSWNLLKHINLYAPLWHTKEHCHPYVVKRNLLRRPVRICPTLTL